MKKYFDRREMGGGGVHHITKLCERIETSQREMTQLVFQYNGVSIETIDFLKVV